MGGKKVPLFLKALNAPSQETVDRHWRENLVALDDGITDHNSTRLVEVCTRARAVLKVPEGAMIPCELSEDESASLKGLQHSPKRNEIDGVCGEWQSAPSMARSRDHTCDFKHRVVLECDKTNYEPVPMMKAVALDCHGNYIRVIMVNPILAGMPKLVVMVQCTCNKFTRADVNEQWDLVEAAFNRTLRDQCGMFSVGNASDGDERRFKLQKKELLGRKYKGGPLQAASRCGHNGLPFVSMLPPQMDLW
jgi:hypothetical protein